MKKPMRVLIVDDSDDDGLLLLHEMERGGLNPVASRVDTLAKLNAALEGESWDVILCDHFLPGFDSFDVLRIFTQKELDIPVIIVSGYIGEEAAIQTMKSGASDYVMKSHLKRLVPVIERELREAGNRRARRRAEKALQRNEEELRDFFEHASVGLQWVGPEGIIQRVNQAELAMLDYAESEYVGRNFSEFYVDKDEAAELLSRLHADEAVTNFETRLFCKDGSIKQVLINSNVFRKNGKFIHSRSITRDITDRKAAESTRAYLAAIVNSSNDAIIGLTLDGVILSWNSGAERMYGFTQAEMLGKSISALNPHYRIDDWPQIYGRLREGQEIHLMEAIRQRKDGTGLEVEMTLSPIKDELGELIGISDIESDISERKGEENERLRLISELTEALSHVNSLTSLLPICGSCKRVIDDQSYWNKLEDYISEHSHGEFSRGVCQECARKLCPESLEAEAEPPLPM